MSNEKIHDQLAEVATAYEEITGGYWLPVEVPEQKMFLRGWVASRAAIEVEIPGYDSLLRALYDGVDINDVVEAIKAQGLKVKVTP